MKRGELAGISPELLAKLVLNGRAEGTIRSYGAALKRIWAFGSKICSPVFSWGEGELCSFLNELGGEGFQEGSIKQVLAVVNMVFEAMGKSSPTKAILVHHVKKAVLKGSMNTKKSRGRALMSVRHLDILLKNLYKTPADRISPVERRCLMLQVVMFLGMKRFSDIKSLKVKDVEFKHGGAVEIELGKTKTDQVGRGSKFVIVGDSKRGLLASDVMRWYLHSFRLSSEDFLFPSFRNGKGKCVSLVKNKAVSYGSALSSLRDVCQKLGLPRLTLHSARIGACTAGAKAGVSRAYLQACGNWKSSAVDGYVRLEDPGLVFNRAIFKIR